MNNKSITIRIFPIIIISVIIAVIFNCKTRQSTIDNDVTFEVDDIVVSSGEEVTINIKMLKDLEFVAANFELSYDSTQMEYIKYEKGTVLENGAMSIVNNDKDNQKVLIAYVGNPQDETQIVEKGDLLSITFKLNDSIHDIEITPQFKCTTLKQKDGEDVQNFIKQGTISVK